MTGIQSGHPEFEEQMDEAAKAEQAEDLLESADELDLMQPDVGGEAGE